MQNGRDCELTSAEHDYGVVNTPLLFTIIKAGLCFALSVTESLDWIAAA